MATERAITVTSVTGTSESVPFVFTTWQDAALLVMVTTAFGTSLGVVWVYAVSSGQPPPPPPPPEPPDLPHLDPLPPRRTRAATWQLILVPPLSTSAIGEITDAHARKLHIALDDRCTASFTMDGRSRQARQINEMEVDLMMARDREWFFRGRLGTSEDSVSTDSHEVAFNAVDYRGFITDSRFVLNAAQATFPLTEQTEMLWALINATQQTPNGDLGIRRGSVAQSGQLREGGWEVGKSIGEAGTQMSQRINGFKWEIDAWLRYNAYYPARGSERGLVLDYGRAVTNFRREWDAGIAGNVAVGQGGQGLVPVILDGQAQPYRPGTRKEVAYSNQDLTLQQTLHDQTAGVLRDAQNPVGNYTLQLANGVWAPNLLWVGDTTPMVIRTGRLAFNALVRVLTIDITISDDGHEAVQLEVGRLEGTVERQLSSVDRRLRDLERGAGGPLTRWTEGSAIAPAAAAGIMPLAAGSPAEVEIGTLPNGQFGLRADADVQAPRGIDYGNGQHIRMFFNQYPAAPQVGDVVLVPR